MTQSTQSHYTAFAASQRIATGNLREVAAAVKKSFHGSQVADVLIFEDGSGHLVDVDFRGTIAEVVGRIPAVERSADNSKPEPASEDALPRGPGRPKLGVIAREVTLLPRHWDWLNTQTGGASVALRKLVEEARRNSVGRDRIRLAQEASYRFLSATLSYEANFEEVARALFAGERDRFDALVAEFPGDLRDYLKELAEPALQVAHAIAVAS